MTFDTDFDALRWVEPTLDAFGRLRVSNANQRLDVEFIYDKQPNFFDETTSNGTVTFNSDSRDLTLSLSDANNGSHATMRSHPVPYTPGNSHLVELTGVLDLAGIGGGTAQCFVRTSVSGSVVETTYDQSTWINPVSDIFWEYSHIFVIDLQSLKVGRIRFQLNRQGSFVRLKEVYNDNLRNVGYWQLPSLGAYWRIYNDATYTYMELGYGDEANAVGFRYRIAANASATMKAICCTVKSEDGRALSELEGLQFSANRGVTAATVSTTRIPLLSIRAKSTFNSLANLALAIPQSFSVKTDEDIRVDVISGGTLTSASFASVDANSAFEYDTAATAITGGTVIDSAYTAGAAKNNAASSDGGFLGKSVLWNRQSSETGILTLAAVRTGANNANTFAGMTWRELR